ARETPPPPRVRLSSPWPTRATRAARALRAAFWSASCHAQLAHQASQVFHPPRIALAVLEQGDVQLADAQDGAARRGQRARRALGVVARTFARRALDAARGELEAERAPGALGPLVARPA